MRVVSTTFLQKPVFRKRVKISKAKRSVVKFRTSDIVLVWDFPHRWQDQNEQRWLLVKNVSRRRQLRKCIQTEQPNFQINFWEAK